jgi:hypothetical protein
MVERDDGCDVGMVGCAPAAAAHRGGGGVAWCDASGVSAL